MISQGRIGPAEAVVLLAITMSARLFMPYPRSLSELGGSAAWMTPIGGLLVALLGVLVISGILAKSPGKNIVQATEDALGPYLGTAVNIIYALFFIMVAMDFSRVFSEALIIAALGQTPISVISVSFLALSLLAAHLGLEAMSRTARLSYPYILLGIIILFASLYPHWDINNFFPVLGNGVSNVFIMGTFSTAAVSEVILLGVIAQSLGDYRQVAKVGIHAVLISFIFLMLLLIVTNLTYHWTVAQEFSLPFYSLARAIELGRFFQRVESFYIVIWSFFGIAKIAVAIYVAALVLAQTLKLPDYRPLLWVLGMVVFTSSLLPPDLPSALKFDEVILRPVAWLPNYIIPIILLLVLSIRGRRRDAG